MKKDATRFKKTYSFSKFSKQEIRPTTIFINNQQKDNVDLTRFRKSYSFTRQQPQIWSSDYIAEAGVDISTLPYLWLVPNNNGLYRITTKHGARAQLNLSTEAPFIDGVALSTESSPMLYGKVITNDDTIKQIVAYDPSIRAIRPANLNAFRITTEEFTRTTIIPGKGIYTISYNGTASRRKFSSANPDGVNIVSTGADLWGSQASIYDSILEKWIIGDFSGAGGIRKVNIDTLLTESSITGFQTQCFCFREPSSSPGTRELIAMSVGGNTIRKIDPVAFTVSSTSTITGMVTPGDLAYDPTRDEIWVTSLSTNEVYRLKGSDLSTLSKVSSGLNVPYQIFYEPYATGTWGTTGDRVWVLQGFTGATKISVIDPTNPTVIEESLTFAGNPTFSDYQNLKAAYSPASVGFKDPSILSSSLPLFVPEDWPIPEMKSSIYAAHFRGGSHNEIDGATGRVNKIIDLSGNGRHMIPSGNLDANRCLHVDSEPIAKNNPCFRFSRDAHMVSNGWTLGDIVGTSSGSVNIYKEFQWYIVYRCKTTPTGSEVLFGSFYPSANLGVLANNASATSHNTQVTASSGVSTSQRTSLTGSRSNYVFAHVISAPPFISTPSHRMDRVVGDSILSAPTLNLSGGFEMGKSQNPALTATDADIYEIFLLKRASTAGAVTGHITNTCERFFDRYSRQKYGT